MTTGYHVLRVFLGPDGGGGNPLGVFVDGRAIAPERRLAVAQELAFSETVFVDTVEEAHEGDDEHAGAARIAIFTPGRELAFAGHPTVGTAWLLDHLGMPVSTLHVPAGDVATWSAEPLTWIRARASWVHPIELRQYGTAAEVDALPGQELGEPGVYVWAWENEAAGRLRSRYFATDVGIREDEATGAAAVVIGEALGRPLTIRQGVGSELHVRPDPAAGTVDVGGRVAYVEARAFDG